MGKHYPRSTATTELPRGSLDMELIAGLPEQEGDQPYSALINIFQQDPLFAKQMGKLYRHASRAFTSAHPGEVRDPKEDYTPEEWNKAGYPRRARLLTLMGQK